MKTTPNLVVSLMAGLLLLTASCKKEETAAPQFEQENAAYTGQFAFKTKSQQFAVDAQGRNIAKVVIDGTGTFSFTGAVTFTDEFDFVLATGAAAHKVTYTLANGDKIYATMNTQVGASTITGTSTFTGGTGRFAKITGSSPNVGPPVSATGEGTWKEEGGKVTF